MVQSSTEGLWGEVTLKEKDEHTNGGTQHVQRPRGGPLELVGSERHPEAGLSDSGAT